MSKTGQDRKPIISSVSLDEETKEIAKSMPNFSSFVRECLIRWRYEHQADKARHLHPTSVGYNPQTDEVAITICYPHSKHGLCLLCWPEGAPDVADWKAWRSEWLYDHRNGRMMKGEPVEWIQERARGNNTREAFHMTDFKFDRAKSAKTEKVGQDRKWVRILAVLRFWD